MELIELNVLPSHNLSLLCCQVQDNNLQKAGFVHTYIANIISCIGFYFKIALTLKQHQLFHPR